MLGLGEVAAGGRALRSVATAAALAALGLAGPGLCARPASAEEASAEACRRLDLRPAPQWSISGAWVEEGEVLALVDVERGAILRYRPDGTFAGEVSGEGTGFSHPTDLYVREDGTFLLEDQATRLLVLDEDLDEVRAVDLRFWRVELADGEGWIGGTGPAGPAGEDVVMLVPTRTDEGVVYALVRLVPQDWQRKGPDSPGEPGARLQGRAVPGFDGGSEQFFGLTRPVTASLGDALYMLGFLEGELGIYDLARGLRRLEAYPAGFSRVPELPPSGGRDGSAERYGFLEGARMPAGLYAREGLLYVLTREPAADGPLWRLHAIDAEQDRVVRSVPLPTKANHIFLVPGPSWWAIVEKGAVGAGGQQPIPSAVLVPSSWIEDRFVGVLSGEGPACPRAPRAEPVPAAQEGAS